MVAWHPPHITHLRLIHHPSTCTDEWHPTAIIYIYIYIYIIAERTVAIISNSSPQKVQQLGCSYGQNEVQNAYPQKTSRLLVVVSNATLPSYSSWHSLPPNHIAIYLYVTSFTSVKSIISHYSLGWLKKEKKDVNISIPSFGFLF